MLKRIKTVQVLDTETGEKTTLDLPVVTSKTQYNNDEFSKKYEVNDQPSATVPNMAMSVKELIARFASGLPLNVGKVPIYENGEFPDIDDMDIIERHEYYKQLKADREAAEDRVSKARTKAEEMKMEKIVKERVEKRIQEEAEKAAKKRIEEIKGGQQ